MLKQTAQELYAELYDLSVPDWPGELDFYRELVASFRPQEIDVLEIACGTGRITLRLAQDVAHLTGLDLSEEILAIARQKSSGIANIDWVQGDMRAFDLGKQFHLAIIPGHSFQAMLTPDDQAQCLETIRRHLRQGGVLVVHLDHQDFRWLGGLLEDTAKRFETDLTLTHPRTGQEIRRSHRWTFEPATQTATIRLRWEAYGEDGSLVDRWELDPMRLHCVFRFEMEHLLRGAGFSIEAVYGDFFKSELCDDSGQMIWVARNPAG